MSDFKYVKNADGTVTKTYAGPTAPAKPAATAPDPQARGYGPLTIASNPILSTGASLNTGFQAFYDELMRQKQGDRNLARAYQVGLEAYANDLQRPGSGRGLQRVVAGGGRNLAQSLANLQGLGKEVSAGDSPFPLLNAPLPPVKPKGDLEKFGQDMVTTSLAWVPATRLLSIGARGALMVPGVASATAPIVQAGKTAAAFAKGAGPVVPFVNKPVGAVAVKAGQLYTEGAGTGYLVDLLAFSPEAQAAQKGAEDWVNKNEGIVPGLREYVQSEPGDTQAEARFKQANMGAAVTGPAFNYGLFGISRVARGLFNMSRKAATRRPAAEPPTVDVDVVDPANPVNPTSGPNAPMPVGGIKKGGQAAADLERLQSRQPRPYEAPGVATQERLDLPNKPWQPTPPATDEEIVAAAREIVSAQSDLDRAAVRAKSTVPDEVGAPDLAQQPTAVPTRSMVRQVSPQEVVARPQEMQYKAAGQLNRYGTSGSLTKAEVFDEQLGGLISVWRDPATGELVVVNGHNRLRLAQMKGAEAINVMEISAASAQEARAIGALQNIAEGQGTAWDAAKLMRDMSYTPGSLQEKGIDLGGRIARDAVPLTRLPKEIFEKGATGGLSLDKAIALGSVEGLDEAVVRDVAARAAKGKFSADKIAQAMQEARFATTQGPAGGVLPGMEELFKTSNFDQLLNVRTEAYRALREQMVALSSAANLKRTGILEAAGNVIDVEGSRAAKDQAAAALNLFNQVTGYVGPVRELLTEMAGQIKGKVSAKKVVAENLDRLRNAIEAEVNGSRLPLEEQPAPTRQLTPEQERTLLGSEGRVQALQELDPQRLAQERQQAVKILEAQERQTAERLSTAAQKVSPEAVTDADRYGLNPRYVQKWMDLPETALATEIRLLAGNELSQRQYTNRVQRLQAMDANDAAVAQYLDEMPGSNSAKELSQEAFDAKYGDTQPVLTPRAELNKVTRELDRHDLAVAAVDWYNDWAARPKGEVKRQAVDATPAQKIQAREEAEDLVDNAMGTLLPEQRDEAEALIRRALAGEVTPEQRAMLEGKPAAGPAFTLPEGLSKAAPRYGYGRKQFTLQFASDLDRTAYVLANDVKTRSKSAGKFEEAVAAAGLDLPAIRSHGDQVRSYIKGLAKDAQPGRIDIPDQGFGGREAPLASEAPAGGGAVEPTGEGLPGLRAAVVKHKQDIARQAVDAMRRELDRWVASNPEPVGDAAARLRWVKERSSRVQDVIGAGEIMLEALKAPVGKGRVVIPERYGFQWAQLSPDVRRGVGQTIAEDLKRMLGDEIGLRFEDGFFLHPKADAWGGTGNPADLSFANGVFDPFENLITLYNFRYLMGGVQRKISTAWHEAWHAIQYNFLTLQELRALNGWFAQVRLGQSKRADAKGLIEQQATSYERYVYARENGLPVAAYMLKVPAKLLKGTDLSPEKKAMVDAAAGIIETFDRLTDFVEKVGNFLSTRGWTSTRQLFEDAYSGRLAQRGPLGNALEEGGERARVLRATKRKSEIGIEGRFQGLASEMEPPKPPGTRSPDLGDDDPDWVTRWTRTLQENKERLLSGETTMEELYAANKFAKPRSPSGAQVYTGQSEDLIPGLSAMSDVSPGRPEMTGFRVFNGLEVQQMNQQWFDRHGEDGQAILSGLDKLTGGFSEYEHGALNRAMDYADKLQVRAQEEAAIWLTSAGDPNINRQVQLSRLIVAADSARRMHIAIAKVTRPWGQLGLEMQMPRDYGYGPSTGQAVDVPATAVVEGQAPAAAPAAAQGEAGNVVETALREELDVPAGTNPVVDEVASKFPDLREAVEGGEMTIDAEAVADEIANTLLVMGDQPAMRTKLWRAFDSLPPGASDRENPLNALQVLRSSNLLTSGVTVSKNLFNGVFNLSRLTVSQAVGGALERDWERALYSTQMFGNYLNNIGQALRVASTTWRTGRPTFNIDSSSLDFLDRIAAREAQAELAGTAANARTGYTLNTLDMSQQFAESRAGKFANGLWQTLGTVGGRAAITIDAFNSSLAGHSYEFFRHMPRGMELAVNAGHEKFSKEAFDYAYKYAEARVDQAIRDVAVNGETLADMAMQSPHAQKFMDAVNFTDKIWADLEPRDLAQGMQIGKAQGLSGSELTDFARKYVDEGLWYHKAADAMLNGPLPVGRLASLPGEALDTLSNMKFVGPVFRFIQPFQRVPSNIIKSTARNTPAAVFVDTWWRDVASSDPGTRQRALGEFAVGSGVAVALWTASNLGRIRFNGGGPIDPQLKEKWLKDRQMPYSVQFWDEDEARWGDAWSVAAFEPFASLLGGFGDYSDTAAMMTTEQREQAGASLVFDLMKLQASGLLSKTYFSGINELYEAAFDPSKVFTGPNKRSAQSRFLQRTIASMVPYSSALRQARRSTDPISRSVMPSTEGGFGGFWQETWDEIKNALPGFSQELPAKRDWTLPGAPPVYTPSLMWSNELAENAPFAAALMQFVPFVSAFAKGYQAGDPVQQEMFNMHGKGTTFSGPRASDFGREMYLSPTELGTYQEMFATVKDETGRTWHTTVESLIRTRDYQSLPVEPPSGQYVSYRAAMVQSEIDRYKKLAKDLFLNTTPKGAEIKASQEQLQGRQDELNYIRQYGVPGASATGADNFQILELNR